MFAVIEIQKDGDTAVPITTLFADKGAAHSKYHEVLAAAAVSSVPEHSAILISEENRYMLHEKFVHEGE